MAISALRRVYLVVTASFCSATGLGLQVSPDLTKGQPQGAGDIVATRPVAGKYIEFQFLL